LPGQGHHGPHDGISTVTMYYLRDLNTGVSRSASRSDGQAEEEWEWGCGELCRPARGGSGGGSRGYALVRRPDAVGRLLVPVVTTRRRSTVWRIPEEENEGFPQEAACGDTRMSECSGRGTSGDITRLHGRLPATVDEPVSEAPCRPADTHRPKDAIFDDEPMRPEDTVTATRAKTTARSIGKFCANCSAAPPIPPMFWQALSRACGCCG